MNICKSKFSYRKGTFDRTACNYLNGAFPLKWEILHNYAEFDKVVVKYPDVTRSEIGEFF